MSEARALLPDNAGASAMNLRPGLPPPSGDVVWPSPGANISGGAPQQGAAPQPSLRDQIKAQWMAAGATEAGAEGAVRWAEERESGLNPRAVGDNGTSFGIYMHHGPRALRLLDFAQSQNKIPSDPFVQTALAIDESTKGLDPIATAHAASFMKASDPEAAKMAFGKYFERPATLYSMMHTPSGGGAGMAGLEQSEQEISQLSERDRAEYERLRNAPDPNAKERSELLIDARERAREAREAYANLSSNPPPDKPIGALENFGSFGTMLALLIGGMGRHHLNGALAAAGAMMQAAQANNHEQFERQYKIWDHRTTSALNLAQLERGEIRDLLEDKRMSENERQARLHSFFEEHQMAFQAAQAKAGLWEHVYSAEQAAKRAQEGVAASKLYYGQMMFQNWLQSDEGRKATPEKVGEMAALFGVSGGRVPPAAGQVAGEEKQIFDEIQAARALPDDDPTKADKLRVAQQKQDDFNKTHGKGLDSRSPIGQIMSKLRQEHPEMSSDQLGNAYAALQAKVGAERAITYGKQGDAIRFFNVAVNHLDTLEDAAKALKESEIDKGKIPLFNQLAQRYAQATGEPAPTTFDAIRTAVGSEVSRAITGGQGALTDREEYRGSLNRASSPDQLYGPNGIIPAYKKLMAGQLAGFRQQFQDILTPDEFERKLSPRARTELEKLAPGAGPGGGAGQSYGSPDDVYKAFDAGQLTKEQAKQVLIDKFGAKAQ